MQKPLLKLLGACLFYAWVVYFVFVNTGDARATAFVFVAFLLVSLSVVLAKLTLDVISAFRQHAKDRHYRDLNGRHYAFRTQSIEVNEDDEHDRWIGITSIRQVLKSLPANPVLKRIFQDQMTDGPTASIHVDALIDYLRRAHDHRSIQFKLWLEREVSLPAQNRKKRRTHTT